MNINDYGMNAYKETLSQGYKRFRNQNGSQIEKADADNDKIKEAFDKNVEKGKIPPPDIPGRIMDFKI